MTSTPTVLVAILAKDKAEMLPEWLKHLENWDYPKHKITLYIRSNDNNDNTEEILKEFEQRNANRYNAIISDYSSENPDVRQFKVHEWNAVRFKTLGAIRNNSLIEAWRQSVDYYFVVDVDNFILPDTLSELVKRDLPVVAPMLQSADPEQAAYSNYHNIATERGYYAENPYYYYILRRDIKGLIECDVVHCTYLIRWDVIRGLSAYQMYRDETDDYEYVVFSRHLRQKGIKQYLDNTRPYGCLTTRENVPAVVTQYKEMKEEWQEQQE